jgi:hypothetical protein
LQRFDETRQIIHGGQARTMDDDGYHNVLHALAFLEADSATLAEQQQWFVGKPDYENFGLALVSDTEAFGGHLGKARELTKRAVNSAVRADRRKMGQYGRRMLLCNKGLTAILRKRGSQQQGL